MPKWVHATLLMILAGWLGDNAQAEVVRAQAPITITQPAPLVELALPASVYGHSQHPDLQDLRLVDAHGQRVPFALLPPPPGAAVSTPPPQPAKLFALPTRASNRTSIPKQPSRVAVGWLVDLGPRAADTPSPIALQLGWSDKTDFTASFELESSDDLHTWYPVGHGQLMALHTAEGTVLEQSHVPITAEHVGRYLHILWGDVTHAPTLNRATALWPAAVPTAASWPAATQTFAPIPASSANAPNPPPEAKTTDQVLLFDVGGAMPLRRIDLILPPGNRLIPVRWQQRLSSQTAWEPLATHVHFRLERNGQISQSEPLSVHSQARYIRAVVDARAGMLDTTQTQLHIETEPAHLVFVHQGTEPYELQTSGAPHTATDGPLPVTTLVPQLAMERPHFGQASLGAWQENTAATPNTDRAALLTTLRPWALWAVLLLGVAGLGTMVWRLSRGDTDLQSSSKAD